MAEVQKLQTSDSTDDTHCNIDPFDRVFDEIGHFGKSQLMIQLVLGCMCVASATNVVISAWTHATPEFSCNKSNETYNEDNCGNLKLVACPTDEICEEYTYDDSTYQSTVVTEYNLVCGDSYKSSNIITACYVGFALGAFLCGTFSDNFGRRRVILIAMSTSFISAMVGSVMTNLTIYTVLRFIDGAAAILSVICSGVLVVELIGKTHRTRCMFYHVGFGWALGFVYIGLCAYFIRDWRQLHRGAAYIYVLFIVGAYFIVPESPRWLVTNGRNDEAIEILEKIATGNNKKNVDLSWVRAVNLNQDRQYYTFVDLFRNGSAMAWTTVLLMMVWSTCGVVGYGLALSLGMLPGSSYVNNVILAVVPLPGYVLLPRFIEDPKYGRQKVSVLLMGSTALCCLVFTITWEMIECVKDDTTHPLVIANLASAFLARFTISNMFNVIYFWSSELYPTAIRSTGTGFTSTAARIASIGMPYVVSLGKWMPGGFMTAVAVLCTFVCMRIAETAGKPMVNTFDDARRLYSKK